MIQYRTLIHHPYTCKGREFPVILDRPLCPFYGSLHLLHHFFLKFLYGLSTLVVIYIERFFRQCLPRPLIFSKVHPLLWILLHSIKSVQVPPEKLFPLQYLYCTTYKLSSSDLLMFLILYKIKPPRSLNRNVPVITFRFQDHSYIICTLVSVWYFCN